ncbi:MAG: hydrogenase maturation protease [Anaerolineales bacterium]
MNMAEDQQARPSSILVLGLGNPILGDDGVGWRVAERVRSAVGDQPGAPEVDCAALGGLSLMERMLGYDRVILIDSMCTGQQPEGAIDHHALHDLPNPGGGHTASAHDTSLATALQTAETLGAQVPTQVDVVAIETAACYEFSEALSPAVEAAVPVATRKVLELILA